MTEPSTGSRPDAPRELFPSIVDEMRVLIVAGVMYGAVVAGLGSRLAMLVLRVTSPDSVIGVQSDDDFTIGTFTIGGTYNLLLLGAVVGMVGAGAYRLVRPWLIGPTWFRRLTTGLASGAVVGSMLVHADGIDFRVLKPTWFAIGLFVLLPGVFGTFIGPVVDRVASDDSWTRRGRLRWALPVVSLLAFPPSIAIVPFVAAAATALLACREIDGVQRMRTSIPYGLAVRSLWLGIAVLGLVALIGDIVDVSRVV
jgi:hypothetical protein